MDPENPLALFALVIFMSVYEQSGTRVFLYLDEASATAGGEKMKENKPAEITSFHYVVLPLEGPVT